MKNEELGIIKKYLTYLSAVRGVSVKTMEAYTNDLTRYENYCINHNIIPENANTYEIRQFIEDLYLEGISNVSSNRYLSSVRGFYKWLVTTKKRKDNPCWEIKNVKPPLRLLSILETDEMSKFVNLPDTTGILWPERDKALILVMYSAGLRISEIASLSIENMINNFNEARIMGKGNKMRIVLFSEEAVQAISEYLPARSSRLKMSGLDDRKGALFISRKGNPLSIPGVRWIISRYVQESGFDSKIHPHTFRHSFATHLVDSGCDVRVVQEMLGHANISTTQKYTHTKVEKMKRVHRKSHPHNKAVL